MKKILFLVLLLSSVTSFASHFVGGDIEYQWIGQRQWKIKLSLYRDCMGCPTCFATSIGSPLASPGYSGPAGLIAKPNATLNPPGCFTNPAQLNVNMVLVKVEDVMKNVIPVCGNSAKNGCTNLGTVNYGLLTPSVEKWIFEGTLNLNITTLNNSCATYWDILYTAPSRNGGMLNISASDDISIGATINIYDRQSSGKNNSPVITNGPVNVVCSKREFNYNMGAIDVDGDSLSYHLAPAFREYPRFLATYINGYSYKYPFPLDTNASPHNKYPNTDGPYVILDSITGDMSFTPINNTPNYIYGDLCVLIKQWTKDAYGTRYLAGQTMRDMQYFVVNCPTNNIPKLATAQSLANGEPKLEYVVNAGDEVCFTITAKDTDVIPNFTHTDTTYITWNNGIVRPGKLTFEPTYSIDSGNPRPREDQWQFCWKTELADIRNQPYNFTTTLMDNACPRVGQITKVFSIKVIPNIKFTSTKVKLGCNIINYQIQRNDTTTNISSIEMKIAKSPNDFSFNNGYTAYYKTITGTNNSIFNENLVFSSPGSYLVSYNLVSQGNSKTLTDTIVVAPFPSSSIQISDTSICRGDTVKFNLSNEYNYTWKQSGSNTVLSNSNVFWYVPTSTVNLFYTATAKDSIYQGCMMSDTSKVVVKYKATVEAGTDKLICSNESNFSMKAKQGITVGGYVTNSSGVTISDIFRPSQAQVYPAVNKFYFVNDTNGCVSKDSFIYTVKRPAVVEAGTNKTMCSNDAAFSLRAKQGVTISGYFANSSGVTISDTFSPGQALTYPSINKLYFVNDSTGCIGKDSFTYQVNPMPIVNAGSDKNYCATDTIKILETIQQPQPNVGGGFYDEKLNLVTTFNPTMANKLPATNSLVFKYTRVIMGFTCYGYDTAVFTVTPIAVLQPLTGDTVVAKNAVKTYSTPSNPYHTLLWNITGGQLQSTVANTAEIVWTDTGMANIQVTAQNAACADVVMNQSVLVQPTSGLSEQGLQQLVKLYPNPANQSVTISLASNKDAQIEIYNATMQLQKQVTAQSVNGLITEHLSIQEMANGVYFVRVTTGNQSGLFKLVVMK